MHQLPAHPFAYPSERIAISQVDNHLVIEIHPHQWGWEPNHHLFHLAAFAILALCGWIVASITHYGMAQFSQGLQIEGAAAIITAIAFVLLLWIATEAWLVEATEQMRLELGPDQFHIRWQCRSLRGKCYQTCQGHTRDIDHVRVCTRRMGLNIQCRTCPYRVFRYFPFLSTCVLWEGDRIYEFGYYLPPPEQKWLVEQVQQFLRQ
jgi:hypothetical protein